MRIGIATVTMVLALAGAAGTLLGQTYEWTDANGVVHFTDNQEAVPRKYKGTVRVRESVRGSVEDQAVPQQAAPPVRAAAPPKGEDLYNGKPFTWWRARYGALADQREKAVARLEELKTKEAATKRKKLILQRASDRAAVKEVEGQLADQEERIKKIDANIAELTEEALKAGVPARWNE